MFKSLRFPLAYILELVVALPLFVSLYFTGAFVASTPATTLRASGARIPASWEAALPNHGGYLRAFSAAEHPFLLAVSLAILALCAWISWKLRVAQVYQRKTAPPELVKRHTVANAITFVGWGALAFCLVTLALPKLAAA